jgi:hypothetical protein
MRPTKILAHSATRFALPIAKKSTIKNALTFTRYLYLLVAFTIYSNYSIAQENYISIKLEPLNINGLEMKPQAATIGGVSGELNGYWDYICDKLICVAHPTSVCYDIVINIPAAYRNLSCIDLKNGVYTNAAYIEDVKLYRGSRVEGNLIGSISNYSVFQQNTCGVDNKDIQYELGNWPGVYTGSININTCILEN